jgi:deoxyribonuclease V
VLAAVSHPWHVDKAQASALQTELASLVVTEDRLPDRIDTVAGVDVAYAEEGSRAFAAIAIYDVASQTLGQTVCTEDQVRFPYSPGLLSFRELPVLAAAFEKLSVTPDLVVCDGQGIAHPRRFGLACHVGVVYNLPTIGCAKTRLIGEADEPGWARGSTAPLRIHSNVVGAVVRTRDGVKPLYVSPGHRISTDTACDWIVRLASRFRLPEPIRFADQAVNRMKREARSREG